MFFSVETVRLVRGSTGTRLRATRSGPTDQNFLTQLRRNYPTTGFFSLSTDGSVPLYSVQELLPASRVPDVLDPDVHPLLNVSVANNLVDNDTNSARGDIVDDAGSTVVMCESYVIRREISRRTHGSICVAYPFAGLR